MPKKSEMCDPFLCRVILTAHLECYRLSGVVLIRGMGLDGYIGKLMETKGFFRCPDEYKQEWAEIVDLVAVEEKQKRRQAK